MLYDGQNPVVKIIGVHHMKWTGGIFNVAPRKHSALAFRIKGEAVIGACENEYRVGANDVLYIPQNMGYTAQYTDTEMIVVHFITLRDGTEPEVYSPNSFESIYKAFANCLSLWENKQTGYELFVISETYRILGILHKAETEVKLPSHFLSAVSYINSNYRSPDLTITQVCKYAGISETPFRILFKSYYKTTPIAYINGLRIEYARSLISNGANVESAALDSGFGDPKYFSRIVKKQYGCTPSAFKQWGK